MNTAAMLALLEHYIDDTIDDNEVAIRILNTGKDKMATAIKARFPDIVLNGNLDEEFAFPSEYHETPVLYAAAMYKANDSSIQEKNSFLGQFEDAVKEFVENYDPPVQYREAPYIQHYTATAGQTEFVITNPSYSRYGNVQIYVDGVFQERYENYDMDGRKITLYNGVSADAIVSAVWDENHAFAQPPYLHWSW